MRVNQRLQMKQKQNNNVHKSLNKKIRILIIQQYQRLIVISLKFILIIKSKKMETVYFKGVQCHTNNQLPEKGEKAPTFTLTGKNLEEITLDKFKGKTVILNIFPSLDTDVCATTVRRFNKDISDFGDTTVLCISMDLPFAANRFCVTEGLDNVTFASAFRSPEFQNDYGIKLIDGPLAGLLARAIIIIDKEQNIKYVQLVKEITEEPDYHNAYKHII